MRRKVSPKNKVRTFAAAMVALASFDVLIWRAVLTEKAPSARERVGVPRTLVRSTSAIDETEDIGVPVRIRIPSIGVDAAIEEVTLAKDGSMDVPKDLLDTGWYALGPRPGETGSAAITGHVDGPHGASAVFTDLHDVRPGDKIVVEDEKGTDIVFMVRKIRTYDAKANAIDVFTSQDGKAHLNLITCKGAWDAGTKQYSERLVVFADVLDRTTLR